ncbi:Eco57I restriction-modification methylase domain-containing protein [Lactiplantibacillus plantarum]|uniref:Eco57I restriction-modification methylase domain-containing protein n=1 Tax=Lactiplantibacillus plantarum TaxID=1590 RepID=UPI0028FC23D8|nr:N-6 DNA methylase [Lactiplantibacillus plantarum]WNW15410.1 N-6 DNA methylase [Lactiplantibacillus plantarum]WNW18384.1 N-6 DNA methylase [Lactiplantibacillus plantarum]
MKINELKVKLTELKMSYYRQLKNDGENFSEETVRSGYINKMLELLGWDTGDLSQVLQERKLTKSQRKRLDEINSKHSKPDYFLCDRGVTVTYLDAKKPQSDFSEDEDIAFQIRSYGWCTGVPFSIVSNFKEFGIYNTEPEPYATQSTHDKAIYFSIDQLINDLEKYLPFFQRDKIINHEFSLDSLGIGTKEKSYKSIDKHFLDYISEERMILGENIYECNPNISENQLNHTVQIIINRIIFIRFLEDGGIEPKNELLMMMNKGEFWQEFMLLCNNRLFKEYDGVMFFPDGFNGVIEDEAFFDFIERLYGNTPYRFDVIDPLLIAQIYELFLGKELKIISGEVVLKKKNINSLGSVSTPYPLALTMVQERLSQRKDFSSVKILDPNAGSGTFLLSAFDFLYREKQLQLQRPLSFNETRAIITKHLYGVDIDENAIEVLRMGLSLKLVLSDYSRPYEFKHALSEFKNNFVLGNSLISLEDVSDTRLEDFYPIRYAQKFPKIMSEGGFDYIFSNPPYVEPKYYPSLEYSYLKKKYALTKGKVDASLFFIKRYFQLLNNNGQLSIITQRRFFNTDYGQSIRTWLVKHGYLKKIVSLGSNSIFGGHITYVAILIGSKKKDTQIEYVENNNQMDNKSEMLRVLENIDKKRMFKTESLENGIWSLKAIIAENVIKKLFLTSKRKFFRVNDKDSKLNITVGPQVLDKKYFYLDGVIDEDGIFHGFNIAEKNKKIELEAKLLKPVIGNKELLSFIGANKVNTYILFPYENNGVTEVKPEYIKNNLPLTWNYLKDIKLKSRTKRNMNGAWYSYTRKQNLKYLNHPKIFIPMTSKNIVSFVQTGGSYGDNSNLNAILSPENTKSIMQLKAIATIMNSRIFNLLALNLSGDASGGYHKLNKQFLGETPIPKLNETEAENLATIYDHISSLSKKAMESYGDRRNYYVSLLSMEHEQLNKLVENMYDISKQNQEELLEALGNYYSWLDLLKERLNIEDGNI